MTETDKEFSREEVELMIEEACEAAVEEERKRLIDIISKASHSLMADILEGQDG